MFGVNEGDRIVGIIFHFHVNTATEIDDKRIFHFYGISKHFYESSFMIL